MNREEALELMKAKVKNKNLQKHMLATEAVMQELARHFGEDEDTWGLTGLLHDIDYDETLDDPSNHGLIGAKILEGRGVEPEIIQAIKAHPGHVERLSRMDKALYAVDPLTGLIVACALIHPDKRLKSIDTEFVLNRFKEKRFASGADREIIKECENFGLSLQEFIEISLRAMKEISEILGL
ncbi:MAG: HDIG domain-containing protein [bacterium]|nr:HDIG domain-containing protein [bacterium]